VVPVDDPLVGVDATLDLGEADDEIVLFGDEVFVGGLPIPVLGAEDLAAVVEGSHHRENEDGVEHDDHD
jgi:hypothetical protein